MDDQNMPANEVISQEENKAAVSLNLESLIKGHIASLEKLQQDVKEQKEMLNNVFENDATFRQHSEQAKEANNVKAQTRQQILKRPDVMNISNKVKAIRADIAEQQTTLSDLLQEYQRVSGQNQIEDHNGEIREIVSTSKLLKKA